MSLTSISQKMTASNQAIKNEDKREDEKLKVFKAEKKPKKPSKKASAIYLMLLALAKSMNTNVGVMGSYASHMGVIDKRAKDQQKRMNGIKEEQESLKDVTTPTGQATLVKINSESMILNMQEQLLGVDANGSSSSIQAMTLANNEAGGNAQHIFTNIVSQMKTKPSRG